MINNSTSTILIDKDVIGHKEECIPFVGHPHEAEMNTAMVCTERSKITVILLEDYTATSTMKFLILHPLPAVCHTATGLKAVT